MKIFLSAPLLLSLCLIACDDENGTDPPFDSMYVDNGPECGPIASDYSPGADDMWPACVSDGGEYVRIQDGISTIARVESFETIAASLFDPMTQASSDAFLQARDEYQIDEGLDSRVVRRYDPHFTVPEDTQCGDEGVPELYPDYCVGPAHLQPILLDAFAEGISGNNPEMQAARIEAALLWFFYVSQYKESLTCTDTAKDCDSSYAYYTGAEPARGGIGLARYVNEVDATAHDRAWDGLLAQRCWRDLDDAEVATDLAQRDLARAQFDRAVLDGVAAIVRDRFERFEAASGSTQVYYWSFLQTLGPVLYPAGDARNAASTDALRAELAKTEPANVDVAAATAAIDAIIACN